MWGWSMRAVTSVFVLSLAAWACAESDDGGGGGKTGAGGSATGGSSGSTSGGTGGTGGSSGGVGGSGGTAGQSTGGSAGASGGGGSAGSSTGGQSGSDSGASDGGSCPLGASLDGAGCAGITGNLSPGARPCVLLLPGAPSGTNVDPNKVNVSIVGGTGITFLGNVCTAADCATHQNGWFFDDNGNPTEIHLCPDACQLLGVTAQPILTLGCPTTAAST